jgi:dTDP-4-amino-4,6-dideoxygalactose transaminase
MEIPFNKLYIAGNEIANIAAAIANRKLAGDGPFTFAVQKIFEQRYAFKKSLLTSSCTDALEMSAILANIDSESEVIIPSYTFVSTANPFALRGAKIVFADSEHNTPNMDIGKIEPLITAKTKAIVVMHYAGMACDMDKVLALAEKYNLIVIEDAAQAIDAYYKGKPLGSIGAMGTFSFHETKNIIAGEGGLLTINDTDLIARAEIIREKGTNRSQFFRGEIDKYGWVDIGSSYLASDLTAAYLKAQLDKIDIIQSRRLSIWNRYSNNLADLTKTHPDLLPKIPEYATNNAHMYYLKCNNLSERIKLIKFLNSKGIKSVFHYLSLHKSKFYFEKHDGRELPESDMWTDCLLRLPMFVELTDSEVDYCCEAIQKFYNA